MLDSSGHNRPPAPDGTEGLDEWSLLMSRVRSGDARAYSQLLKEITSFASRVARRHGLDRAASEDVAQDVLLTLHRCGHRYDQTRPLRPWIYAILRRRISDVQRIAWRVHGIEEPWLGDFVAPCDTGVDTAIERQLHMARLRRIIIELPPRQKQALGMVALGGLSAKEAAARTGQSPGAVRVNLHRPIRSLQVMLGL